MDDKAVAVVPQEHDDAPKGDAEAQVSTAEMVSSKRQRLSDIFTIVSLNTATFRAFSHTMGRVTNKGSSALASPSSPTATRTTL